MPTITYEISDMLEQLQSTHPIDVDSLSVTLPYLTPEKLQEFALTPLDENNNTPLHYVALSYDASQFNNFVKAFNQGILDIVSCLPTNPPLGHIICQRYPESALILFLRSLSKEAKSNVVTLTNPQQETLLHNILNKKHSEKTVAALFKSLPSEQKTTLALQPDASGDTPLALAARNCNERIFLELVSSLSLKQLSTHITIIMDCLRLNNNIQTTYKNNYLHELHLLQLLFNLHRDASIRNLMKTQIIPLLMQGNKAELMPLLVTYPGEPANLWWLIKRDEMHPSILQAAAMQYLRYCDKERKNAALPETERNYCSELVEQSKPWIKDHSHLILSLKRITARCVQHLSSDEKAWVKQYTPENQYLSGHIAFKKQPYDTEEAAAFLQNNAVHVSRWSRIIPPDNKTFPWLVLANQSALWSVYLSYLDSKDFDVISDFQTDEGFSLLHYAITSDAYRTEQVISTFIIEENKVQRTFGFTPAQIAKMLTKKDNMDRTGLRLAIDKKLAPLLLQRLLTIATAHAPALIMERDEKDFSLLHHAFIAGDCTTIKLLDNLSDKQIKALLCHPLNGIFGGLVIALDANINPAILERLFNAATTEVAALTFSHFQILIYHALKHNQAAAAKWLNEKYKKLHPEQPRKPLEATSYLWNPSALFKPAEEPLLNLLEYKTLQIAAMYASQATFDAIVENCSENTLRHFCKQTLPKNEQDTACKDILHLAECDDDASTTKPAHLRNYMSHCLLLAMQHYFTTRAPEQSLIRSYVPDIPFINSCSHDLKKRLENFYEIIRQLSCGYRKGLINFIDGSKKTFQGGMLSFSEDYFNQCELMQHWLKNMTTDHLEALLKTYFGVSDRLNALSKQEPFERAIVLKAKDVYLVATGQQPSPNYNNMVTRVVGNTEFGRKSLNLKNQPEDERLPVIRAEVSPFGTQSLNDTIEIPRSRLRKTK